MQLQHPYHEGELFIQKRLGEVEEGRRNGRIISDSILKGALPFLERQPLAVVGSTDAQGNNWASLLVGKPGYLSAPDDRTLEIDLTRTAPDLNDPLWKNIEQNSPIGMLVIDLGTRRRLRINGNIASKTQRRLLLEITESYPNCPKYIQRRHMILGEQVTRSSEPRSGTSLESEHESFIQEADTFFVASSHPERGVDASHRGGNPGFIKVLSDRRIRIPDYVGNRMFNTLGNFIVNPRAGLLFIDFERDRTFQLTGRAEIQWDLDDTGETGGTGRFWDFEVDRWIEADLRIRLSWELLDRSPYSP